jgi:hypothetical protein
MGQVQKDQEHERALKKKKKSHDVRKFIVKQKINQRNNNSQCKIERILNLTLIWD